MSSMLIAALSALFAVGLVGTSILISGDSGGAVSHSGAVFKTGNPSLGGESAALGASRAPIDASLVAPILTLDDDDHDPQTEARS